MSYVITPRDMDVLVGLARGQHPAIDPRDVAFVLYLESGGFEPGSLGPGGAGKALGLNQMTLDNLHGVGIDPAEWVRRSAAEQLPVIFEFWKALARRFNGGVFPATAEDLRAINFLPDFYRQSGAGHDRDAPITERGKYGYADNVVLDPENTGAITVNTIAEAGRRELAKAGARWAEITRAVSDAVSRAGAIVVPLPSPRPPNVPPAPPAPQPVPLPPPPPPPVVDPPAPAAANMNPVTVILTLLGLGALAWWAASH